MGPRIRFQLFSFFSCFERRQEAHFLRVSGDNSLNKPVHPASVSLSPSGMGKLAPS